MLAKINKFFIAIEDNLAVILFFIMTCITCMNVFTRFFLNYTASWAEQTTRLLFIWSATRASASVYAGTATSRWRRCRHSCLRAAALRCA